MYACTKFVACLLLLSQVSMEYAGEGGVQLSVGVEMEAYGDQAATASNQFSYRRSQVRSQVIAIIEWCVWLTMPQRKTT